MLILASIFAIALAIWAFVLSRHEGTPRTGLRVLVALLLGGMLLGWVATFIVISGSIWAVASETGAARDHDLMTGLGVLTVAGGALLTVCAVAFVVVVKVTWTLNRRLDRHY